MDRARATNPTPAGASRRGSSFARPPAVRAAPAIVLAIVLAACGSGVAGSGGQTSFAPNPTAAPVATAVPNPTAPANPTLQASPNPTLAPNPTPAPTTPPPSPAGSPSATPDAVSFPETLNDDEGTAVVIPAEPQRIISLSPANTEIAFALGAGSRVVGGTDADDYPPAAVALLKVVQNIKVLEEKIVSLRPDLILAAGDGFTPPADIQRLRDLGYPVLVLYAQSVDGVLSDIRLIGSALDEASAAGTLTADMDARFSAIAAAAGAAGSKPRTFYEIGYGPDIYGPAPDSFLSDLITLAGGDPITTGNPSVYSIPLEKLVVDDPQVIVLGDALYGVCPADVAARAGWKGMTAVVSGAVRPVSDTVVTRPGPRLVDGLAALAEAIHPGLRLPDAPAGPPLCGASASPTP